MPYEPESFPTVVLDTNILLDLYVFRDSAVVPLRAALEAGTVNWLITEPMLEEFSRVLKYPQIVRRLVYFDLKADEITLPILKQVDLRPVPAKAKFTCKDPDDQKFINLAVAHRSQLISKDRDVLSMKKRLLTLHVEVHSRFS